MLLAVEHFFITVAHTIFCSNKIRIIEFQLGKKPVKYSKKTVKYGRPYFYRAAP